MAAHQFVGVVQFRTCQQVQADGIDDDPGGATLDDQVVGLCLPVKLEAVLETAAAAGQDGDAKCGGGGRFRLGDDLGDAGGGAVGDGELFHVDKIGAFAADLKRFLSARLRVLQSERIVTSLVWHARHRWHDLEVTSHPTTKAAGAQIH
jgi:hypothetical protein